MKKKISLTINEKILKEIDSIVDNIILQNRSQAIENLCKKALKENKAAVILIGEGKIATRDKLKNRYSLKINHSTLIERAIRKLRIEGFNKIYLVGNHEDLTKIFNIIGDRSPEDIKIKYIDEETPQGTAGALKLLKNEINTTFLLVQSDIIFDEVDLQDLWEHHLKQKDVATMRLCSSVDEIMQKNKGKYGHVEIKGNRVLSYTEKPTTKKMKSSIFFGGIIVLEPEIFIFPGKSLEFDIFNELAKRNLLGGYLCDKEHLHIHTKEDLQQVRKKIK